MRPVDLSAWGGDVRSAVQTAAAEPDFVKKLLICLSTFHQQTEELLLRCDEKERNLIACHAGCDHCCVVNVSISLLEGLAIVRFLNRMEPSVRSSILEKLDLLWSRIRGLDDEERLALRNCCAFLGDDGLCRIYPARPLFCRAATSTDPEACKKAVYSKLRGESHTLLMYQFQQQLYESCYNSVSEGLDLAGLDGRSYQLSGLVRYLVKHPGQGEVLLKTRTLSWADLYA